MNRVLLLIIGVVALPILGIAQPRPMPSSSATKPSPAPESFIAKYEGGMFGYGEKREGKLKFDDANRRLVFYGEDAKELFGIPYGAIIVVYPQSKSLTTDAGNVIGRVPHPASAVGGLLKEKRRYLILHIDDPDANVRGAINFRLENKDLLDSVLAALALKADLEKRGDAFYRPRATKPSI